MQQSVGYGRKGSPLCMDISKFFESVAGYYVTFEAASERPQPGPQSPRSQAGTHWRRTPMLGVTDSLAQDSDARSDSLTGRLSSAGAIEIRLAPGCGSPSTLSQPRPGSDRGMDSESEAAASSQNLNQL